MPTRVWFAGIAAVTALFAIQSIQPANAVYICNPDNGAPLDVALAACDKEIAAGRNLAIAHYDRGLIWNKKNEWQKAINDFNRSLKYDSKYQNAYISRGNALAETGDVERSMADYNQAIKIDASKAGLAYYNRGNRWRDKKENDNAIADYDKAIALMPAYLNAYVARGNIWKTKLEYQKAIADYDSAVQIDASKAHLAYYNRAVTWRRLSQLEKAMADINKYVDIVSSDPDGYITRGNIFADMKDYPKAIAEYDRALLLNPRSALAKSNKANAENHQTNVADP